MCHTSLCALGRCPQYVFLDGAMTKTVPSCSATAKSRMNLGGCFCTIASFFPTGANTINWHLMDEPFSQRKPQWGDACLESFKAKAVSAQSAKVDVASLPPPHSLHQECVHATCRRVQIPHMASGKPRQTGVVVSLCSLTGSTSLGRAGASR